MRPIYVSLAAALLVSLPAAALAHAKLISTTPTAGASVAKPGKVELKFNEKLIAATVKTEIVMTGMPGMKDHPPMKINHTYKMGKDGKSMILLPKRPLSSGTYQVSWSAAGTDTHRMGSEFSFTVK